MTYILPQDTNNKEDSNSGFKMDVQFHSERRHTYQLQVNI